MIVSQKKNIKRRKKNKQQSILTLIVFVLVLGFAVYEYFDDYSQSYDSYDSVDLDDLPSYSGNPYVVINDNEPDFSDINNREESFEYYSDLDRLGRCGVTIANIGRDIMPTSPRESIGQVKPTGWQTIKYDIVNGKYLYNRCHLIGFQLTGENANPKNLITGTRYLNVDGMLPFENMVADFVKETEEHVLYRVTPIFEDENLVAHGVQMEALSVEDDGDSIMFNVFAYNIQPGIIIDYETGESRLDDSYLWDIHYFDIYTFASYKEEEIA